MGEWLSPNPPRAASLDNIRRFGDGVDDYNSLWRDEDHAGFRRRYSRPYPRLVERVVGKVGSVGFGYLLRRRCVTDRHRRIGAQVVHRHRIPWRASLGADQHVTVTVRHAHQRRLADGAGLVADVGHVDDRQPGAAQRQPSVPPLPSYSSTWSRTHCAGLGMYSLITTRLLAMRCYPNPGACVRARLGGPLAPVTGRPAPRRR